MAKNMLTDNLSEPLNDVSTAKIDIHAGDGNLIVGPLNGGEQALATGTLQYFEKQGLPTKTLTSINGQATLTVRGGRAGQPWFRMPWAACNGATEWRIHLNPAVSSDIKAHSDGGNIKLDLSGMAVTRVSADTGGGNVDLALPDRVAGLSVTAKTGAGNVTVSIPDGVAARVHAITGLGKAIIDRRFIRTGDNTYESSDFAGAACTVEVTAQSGAGNVVVATR